MVREKNVLATVTQQIAITSLVSFLWLLCGYSFSVGCDDNSSPIFGDASMIWLKEMTIDSVNVLAPSIPEAVYCMYQLTFAIITAALITGSFADRMRFGPMLLFIGLWHVLVYCPIAHAVWHPNGFLFKIGSLDYAGGTVVHISSGVSGLVAAIVLGHRKGYGIENMEPHNILLTAVGAFMLWVGWFGFNAGKNNCLPLTIYNIYSCMNCFIAKSH
jgi:Amt family ammonium transporter